LSQRLRPCMSKYSNLYSETANGSLYKYRYLIVPYYLDTVVNSRANTC